MSAYARKLATRNNSINIFILSMCRLQVTKDDQKNYAMKNSSKKKNDANDPDVDLFKHINDDVKKD